MRQEKGEGLCELIISHWIYTNLMEWVIGLCVCVYVCVCVRVWPCVRGLKAGECGEMWGRQSYSEEQGQGLANTTILGSNDCIFSQGVAIN